MNALLGIVTGEFWSISAIQVLMLVSMLGGFVLWFSRFEGRIRAASQAITALSDQTTQTFEVQRKLLDDLALRIGMMDREGTRKSQQAILSEEKLQEINERRLDKLELFTLDLAPKVASIVVELKWIAAHIRNGKHHED